MSCVGLGSFAWAGESGFKTLTCDCEIVCIVSFVCHFLLYIIESKIKREYPENIGTELTFLSSYFGLSELRTGKLWNIYFCFIDYAKAFDCVDHSKLWKILKGMGIPDHLTCLLRNLYAGQEAAIRTGHGTTDWFQIGKGVHQGCILSPCLFNLYAEYIMRNTGRSTSWNQDCQEKYQ